MCSEQGMPSISFAEKAILNHHSEPQRRLSIRKEIPERELLLAAAAQPQT
jgi:hypothetical protein